MLDKRARTITIRGKVGFKKKIKNEFVDFTTDGRFPKNIGQERTARSPIQSNKKPARHIGLKRKCQQNGPVPKSRENGAVTNSHKKCKNQGYSQGGALTNPYCEKAHSFHF